MWRPTVWLNVNKFDIFTTVIFYQTIKMSLLDEDYDVSCMIGKYHTQRKNYGNVIQELEKLIDFNVHMEYVKSFQFYKCLAVYSHGHWLQGHLLDVVREIYNDKYKTHHLHNWPSKHPNFEGYRHLKEFYSTHMDNYIPVDKKFRSWKYKLYPPNKDYYPLRSIQFYKM